MTEEPTRAALSWLRLRVTGTVEAEEEAGRVALAAGWAARGRRRGTVELVGDHARDIETRLDRAWPGWRAGRDALAAAGEAPTVRGWRALRDGDRRAEPRDLPSRLNAHTAAAWLRGDAKAALGAAEREVIGEVVVTHDNLLRLRPHEGLVLERGDARIEGDALRAMLGEVAIPHRAFVDGLRLGGRPPERLVLVENLGVYVDLPVLPTWCVAWLPGWNLAMLGALRDAWPTTPTVLFGDLDPPGVMIAAACRREWPTLGWYVPPWSPDLFAVSRPREWPPLPPGQPETIVRLAEAGRWIEQEQLLGRATLLDELGSVGGGRTGGPRPPHLLRLEMSLRR